MLYIILYMYEKYSERVCVYIYIYIYISIVHLAITFYILLVTKMDTAGADCEQ